MSASAPNPSRRAFVKRMTYVGPAVLTLTAAPEYAKAGSVKLGDQWVGKGKGHQDKAEKGGKGKGKRG